MIMLQSQTTQFCNKPTEVGAALTVKFTETAIYINDAWKMKACHLAFSKRAGLRKENYNDSYGEGIFMCSNEFLTF